MQALPEAPSMSPYVTTAWHFECITHLPCAHLQRQTHHFAASGDAIVCGLLQRDHWDLH